MVKAGNGRAPEGRASIIDQGTVFKGTISASSNVIVRGVLEGEITGPGLEVEATGVVIGHAKVTRLRSKGELEGTYEAEQAEVYGRLRDGVLIRADSLTVATSEEDTLTHVFFGECELEIGPLPSQEQAVNDALALAAASVAAPAPVAVVQSRSSAAKAAIDLGSQLATREPLLARAEADLAGSLAGRSDEDASGSASAGARGQKKIPDLSKPATIEIAPDRPPPKRLP
jgi:cytoskeletal protein CcmA (bactofilin family)